MNYRMKTESKRQTLKAILESTANLLCLRLVVLLVHVVFSRGDFKYGCYRPGLGDLLAIFAQTVDVKFDRLLHV